jgi:hypothetical protein
MNRQSRTRTTLRRKRTGGSPMAEQPTKRKQRINRSTDQPINGQ